MFLNISISIWENTVFKVLLYMLFAVSCYFFLKPLFLDYYPDFSSYYFAPLTILHHGNPYLGGREYFTPFVYPPSVILFFLPYSLLPFFIAEKIFTCMSIVSILFSLGLLLKLLKIKLLSRESVILFILFFNFFPEKFTLGMGQINNIVLLFVTLFIYFSLMKKDMLAGIFLAVAVCLKLTPILLLIVLLLNKRWKICLWTLVTLLGITLVVMAVVPLSVNRYFLHIVMPSLISSWKGDYYNQALSGFLVREFTNLALRQTLKIIVDTIVLGTGVFLIGKYGQENTSKRLLSLSLVLILSLLINTFSWQHHFVFLLVPFLIIFAFLRQNRFPFGYSILLFISYILVAINIKNPVHVPTYLQSHVFYGTFILYGLNMWLIIIKTKKDFINVISGS